MREKTSMAEIGTLQKGFGGSGEFFLTFLGISEFPVTEHV